MAVQVRIVQVLDLQTAVSRGNFAPLSLTTTISRPVIGLVRVDCEVRDIYNLMMLVYLSIRTIDAIPSQAVKRTHPRSTFLILHLRGQNETAPRAVLRPT